MTSNQPAWLPIAALIASACSHHAPPTTRDATSRIAAAASASAPELVELRRDLHRHPELAETERRTSSIVAARLRALGLEVREHVGGYGVVGILRGKRPGRVVAYRADMDAFRGEEPEKPYMSTVPGVQHICGHDVHVAVGIGIAKVLGELRDELPGTVVFVFQPAEENLHGAAAMLRDGALADPRPDVIFAVHSWALPVGMIGYAPGEGIAGMDEWTIETDGDGKLATSIVDSFMTVALPQSRADWLGLDRELRRAGGFDHAVVAFTGSEPLPNGRARVSAIIKAVRDDQYPGLRSAVKARLDRDLGPGRYTVTFAASPFPALRSDVREAEAAARTLEGVLGAANVARYRATLPYAGEDFSLFLQGTPGAMFYLGVANPDRGIAGIPHQPDFDVDERAIEIGTRALATVIWQRLGAP